MKWVILAIVIVIGFMIVTGNMGGASNATNNYGSVMRGN